eukprot:sb/3463392/
MLYVILSECHLLASIMDVLGSATTGSSDGVIARLRLLSLHLLLYLYPTDLDYVFMMAFLRDFLDYLQSKPSSLKGITLPVEDCSRVSEIIVPQRQEVKKCSEHVCSLMEQCLEKDVSDFDIACELDRVTQTTSPEPISSSTKSNPLFLWQFMFDPSEYNMTSFIAPLQTGNCGLLVKEMVSFAVSRGAYDARIRTFMLASAQVLRIDYTQVTAYELSAVQEAGRAGEVEGKYKKKKEGMSVKGMAAVGLAATGGAVLLTVTGGLAAPLVVSGLASIVGTSSTAFLATTTGLAAIAATFGAVGGGLTGYKVSKLVGSIDEFEFTSVKEKPSVSLTIMMDGLVAKKENWALLRYSEEQYLLRYESKQIAQFSNALSDFLTSMAVSVAADEVIRYTIFSALAASLTWPAALLSLTSIIDNPWSVCMKRSKAVGIHLSAVLRKRLHGTRPVTLVGYGLGARVIFFCLLDMVMKRSAEEYSGILENAVLCGAPVTSQPVVWSRLCDAISGKLVNGYSTNDWVLSFLYKTTQATRQVAGVRAVRGGDECRKLVNVDLSSVISGHSDYASKMGDVLQIVGMTE